MAGVDENNIIVWDRSSSDLIKCGFIPNSGKGVKDEMAFERKLFLIRKVISNVIYDETQGRDIGFYPVSVSSRTIVYKGMFLADQLGKYYPDLSEPDFDSALALVRLTASVCNSISMRLGKCLLGLSMSTCFPA